VQSCTKVVHDTAADPEWIPVPGWEWLRSYVGTPIRVRDKLIGFLNLDSTTPGFFNADHARLLATFAQQIGVAIENARLYEAERRRAARLAGIQAIGIELAVLSNERSVLDTLVARTAELTGSPTCTVMLVDEATNEAVLAAQAGLPEDTPSGLRVPLTLPIIHRSLETGEPIILSDIDHEAPEMRAVLVRKDIRAFFAFPMVRQGHPFGFITLSNLTPRRPSEEEITAYRLLAERAAAALENARLYIAMERYATRLKVIGETGQQIAPILDLDELLHIVVATLVERFGYYYANILLVDAPAGEIVLRASAGQTGRAYEGFRLKIGQQGITGWVAETGQPLLVNDVAQEPLYYFREELKDTRSELAVPIMVKGQVTGVMDVQSVTKDAFGEEDLFTLQTLAERIAAGIENARLYQSLRASEQEYRTLVEYSTELIWTLDTEGHFTFINQLAEEVSGQKVKDWIGKSFAPLIAPPEDLPRIQQIFLETLGGKVQSYEVGVYRPDGSVFHLSVNTTPLYRDGQVVGTISFGRDVTAQKEAEVVLRRRMAELSALFSVSSALRSAKDVEEMQLIILNETIKVVDADNGAIFLVNKMTGELVASATQGRLDALHGLRLGPTEGICGYVAQTRTPYLFADLASDPHTGSRMQPLVAGVQGGVCVPLLTPETLMGIFIIGSDETRTFSDGELRLLTAIADMATSAIQRAGLFEQLEHNVHELSTLFDVGKMVTASLHIEDVLEFIVGTVTQAVHAEGSTLFLWDEREKRLVLRALSRPSPEWVGRVKYRAGEGLIGWAFLEGRAASVPDVVADPRWKPEPEQEKTLPTGQIRNVLIVPLRIGEKMLGTLGVANKIGAPAFTESDQSLLTALAGQVAIAIENASLYEDVRSLSIATIRSLATAIDARDPYTRGHSEEVTHLAVQLARELGWSGGDLEMLEFAALLHDVGKIAVPDYILRKVEPLKPDEWTIIRLHPYHSAQIVKPIASLQRVIPWIYHHQERWDGTGYPDGLKGEDIPLASRIIAVVDTFNAMTTERPYRKARSITDALEEIERCAGSQFDPRIAETFLKMVREESI